MNELQTFSNGDTNYIQKHNANNANLKAAIEALENNLAAQVAAASGPGSAFDALFGPTAAIIGAESYAMTGSGDVLTVASGFDWKPSIPMVVRNPASKTMSFTGLAAATYYIYADKTGAPVRSTTGGIEDLYSVVWTGSSFGDITRLAPIVWGAGDDFAAQVSTALGQTFTRLDDRLEAGEAAAAAGALARAWQIGRLSKDVSGGANVTLTAVEANNTVLNLTGTLVADIDVVVPLGAAPRLWIVTNNTTGTFAVTVKGASGTGVVVPQVGETMLSQDGTNVFAVVSGSGSGTVKSVNTKTPDGAGAVTLTATDVGADASGAASAAVATHEAASDPHPQYLTPAEADTRYAPTTAATGVSSVNGHTGTVTLGASDVGAVATTSLGAASGVAQLGSDQRLLPSQLPDLAITDYLGTVASQAAMLALTGQKGDWAIRSDDGKVYVMTGSAPSSIGSWTAMSYPATAIPVFGPSGASHSSGIVPDPGATAGTTRFLREDGTWVAPASGGGLTNWVESLTTAAPNTTNPVVSFKATNAATTVDAAIVPKGSGSVAGAIADNTATGGNKRGANSVDWQTSRTNANQVASGGNSVVSGGANNLASATYATVAGGFSNQATGGASFAAGESNVASYSWSIALGYGNTSSKEASVAIGEGCVADATYGVATGYKSSTRGIQGARAHAAYTFSNGYDCQEIQVILNGETSGSTPKVLTANGSMLTIKTNSSMTVKGIVVSRNESNGDTKSWSFEASLKSISGTVSLVAPCTPTVIAADSGASSWSLSVTADNTNKALSVAFTGPGGYWVATVATLTAVEYSQ